MRIRIVVRPSGHIDGVPLDRFDPGVTYDVNASIGTYLMATGHAQAVADTTPARVVPLDTPDAATRGVKRVVRDGATARDRARGRAPKKR